RAYWRLLVSEVLLYAAAEMPEIQTDPDALCRRLAPDCCGDDTLPRERFAPIQQAHLGTRDLVFGGFYRPQLGGYNDSEDVVRLASYLASCDPGTWTPAGLPGCSGTMNDDDRLEELEFARECLLALRAMYAGAAQLGQVVVCEMLGEG